MEPDSHPVQPPRAQLLFLHDTRSESLKAPSIVLNLSRPLKEGHPALILDLVDP